MTCWTQSALSRRPAAAPGRPFLPVGGRTEGRFTSGGVSRGGATRSLLTLRASVGDPSVPLRGDADGPAWRRSGGEEGAHGRDDCQG